LRNIYALLPSETVNLRFTAIEPATFKELDNALLGTVYS